MIIRGKNMNDVKQSNRSAILNLLHAEGNLSRKQLASRLNLTPAAITMIIGDMMEDSIICEGITISNNSSAGRKEIMLEINGTELYAAGVSLNLNGAILSAVNLNGESLFEEFLPLSFGASARDLLNTVSVRLYELMQDARLQKKRLVGIGLSIRGTVDHVSGVSLNSFGLWAEENVPVADYFQEHFNVPVTVDNNVRSLANTQRFLSRNANYASDMLFVRSEMGIGAALILNNKIYTGAHNRSAEIGHLVVVENGRQCFCGNRGCLETVASYQGILHETRSRFGKTSTPVLYTLAEEDAERITFDLIVKAALSGDEGASKVIDTAISTFAASIQAAVKLLDLNRVVFYGKIFENADYMRMLRAKLLCDNTLSLDPALFEKSPMNLKLDGLAGPVIAIQSFFERGGPMPEK